MLQYATGGSRLVHGQVSATSDGGARDSARRHILDRTGTAAFLMRHAANVLVALTVAVDLTEMAAPAGRLLLIGIGGWSVYRLLTRSPRRTLIAADFLVTLAVCMAVPLLVSGPDFHRSNCAPVAIAGTAVISFTLSLPARVSLPMTLTIATAYAYGSAQVIGWSHVQEIFNLYYFALQWAASYVMRFVVLRVAGAVDSARNARKAAEIAETVSAAVRAYDREQTRLLHDTVASTLLLAGQDADVPAVRLAEQARRDLAVLAREPVQPPAGLTELVGALRDLAAHLATPVRFTGRAEMWLDGPIANAVIAASREALTNVDRHARATLVTIDVDQRRVRFTDDGVGFDAGMTPAGFGLWASVHGRMTQCGGTATIDSSPGAGTTVELEFADANRSADIEDPDRLIARTRTRFILVMTAYAVLNVLATAPFSVNHGVLQSWLAVGAVACTLSALPALLGRRGIPMAIGMVVLLALMLVQSMSIPADAVGTQAHWSQGATGWCLLPLLLKLPTPRAAVILILYWVIPAVAVLIRNPSAETLVNIGLGTASILTVQVWVLLIYGLLADAGTAAHTETVRGVQLLARDQVAQALSAEYNRRYAQLIANVVPLLEQLMTMQPLDETFRRKARVECQHMRVLFDQSASFDHPLLQRLRPAIDNAESRGIDVSVHVDGAVPALDEHAINRVVVVLSYALGLSRTSARIALTSDRDGLTASIVCPDLQDTTGLHAHVPAGADDLELTITSDMAWLTVRCAAADAPEPVTAEPAAADRTSV